MIVTECDCCGSQYVETDKYTEGGREYWYCNLCATSPVSRISRQLHVNVLPNRDLELLKTLCVIGNEIIRAIRHGPVKEF